MDWNSSLRRRRVWSSCLLGVMNLIDFVETDILLLPILLLDEPGD